MKILTKWSKALPQNLRDNETSAFMSRKLGEIYVDLDFDFDIEDLKLRRNK